MPPEIREVTTWLLRRAEDLDPRQQQLRASLHSLASARPSCPAGPGRIDEADGQRIYLAWL